jgi:hypothetical protein
MDRQPGQHEHRGEPELALAVPRPPGRAADEPHNVLAELVTGIGIPSIAGRTSAIRQHVLEMPAPVVADALSYHPKTTALLAAQAGGTFSRYAPGDHKRPAAGEGDS